ncbi:MAG: hypothetical protein WBN44_04155, partial [Woeseiaceae bacterium]
EFDCLVQEALLPMAATANVDALVLCCGADCLAGDPLSHMKLSNVALWDAVMQFVALGKPTVVLGGGGYNPWTVTRYWAGLWGRIAGKEIPERLGTEATAFMSRMECELIDEEDVQEEWLTTVADSPYPGPVRDEIRSLLRNAATRTRAAGQ